MAKIPFYICFPELNMALNIPTHINIDYRTLKPGSRSNKNIYILEKAPEKKVDLKVSSYTGSFFPNNRNESIDDDSSELKPYVLKSKDFIKQALEVFKKQNINKNEEHILELHFTGHSDGENCLLYNDRDGFFDPKAQQVIEIYNAIKEQYPNLKISLCFDSCYNLKSPNTEDVNNFSKNSEIDFKKLLSTKSDYPIKKFIDSFLLDIDSNNVESIMGYNGDCIKNFAPEVLRAFFTGFMTSDVLECGKQNQVTFKQLEKDPTIRSVSGAVDKQTQYDIRNNQTPRDNQTSRF